jgi:hypothetical protein
MSGEGKKLDRVLALFVVSGLMGACGGAPPPQTQMTAAQSAVRAAEVGGAEELPKGKLHLKYARDQIQQATALMQEKENEEAERILIRAEVDARYALALAEQEEAVQEANDLLTKIDELMEAAQ